jgi:cyclophilin family peptidyl-prolyl cis-trans isomerase
LNFLDTPFAPTSAYEVKRIEGWQIVVSKELSRKYPLLCTEVLKLLGHKLHAVARIVPSHTLPKLKQVRIWAEYNEGHHPGMVYHPNAGWLKEHGMNPEKAGCVEIANAESFLAWEKAQPYMVLHELAHAYHNQVLRDDNTTIKSAYSAAVTSKSYESVTYIQGGQQKHYALSNPQEYFAELTESYFGTNDFYPFVRPELLAHDPVGFRCIETAWGIVSRLNIVTPLGTIAIEVDNRLAPRTAANFLRYVDEGYYTNSRFHRTVKPDNQPNNPVRIEVIQASIPPENGKKDLPPIALERTSKTTLRHKEGTLSMARLEPDTATCEFFICIGDQPELDFGGKRNPDGQGFAAFGRVVRGMEVVRKIQQSPAKEQDLTPPIPILEIRRRL